jgi:hypothetical protein
MTFALTGNDTIIINNRPLADFGTGDICTLTFADNLTDMQVGKNGNSIITYNPQGKKVDVELKLLAGSSDDKFLNSLLLGLSTDFPSFTLLSGSFGKRIGDGTGAINNINYTLSGGTFAKGIDTKENVEGDKEQAQVLYRLTFASSKREIA